MFPHTCSLSYWNLGIDTVTLGPMHRYVVARKAQINLLYTRVIIIMMLILQE